MCVVNNHGLTVGRTNMNPSNQRPPSESVYSHLARLSVYLLNTLVSQNNKPNVTRSNCCKMLAKLLQELLRVDVIRKGVLRLLGCGVAALKVSDLDRGKKENVHNTLCLGKKKNNGLRGLESNELPSQTEWRD